MLAVETSCCQCLDGIHRLSSYHQVKCLQWEISGLTSVSDEDNLGGMETKSFGLKYYLGEVGLI